MFINSQERHFVNYYLKKYEEFASGIGRYFRKRNMLFLENCLKVYYRLFGDNLNFNKLYDIIDCSDKCRLYLEKYNGITPISTSDAENKEYIYDYFELLCNDREGYQKVFVHVFDFIQGGHMI